MSQDFEVNAGKSTSPSWLKLIVTVAAAAFGVQSEKQREQDFSQKSIVPYIVAGVIFTLLFVLVLIGVVNWVV